MTSRPATSQTVVSALSPAWYANADVFEAEQRLIFAREWTPAGPAAQLSRRGDWLSLKVAGQPVIVLRGDDQRLHAHINVCRHRAGSLLDPNDAGGRCSALSCPYHGWVYALDGTLRAAPGFDATDDFDPAGFSLTPVSVDEWNGIVFVNLDSNPPALLDWLGDIVGIAEDYAPIGSLQFDSVIGNEGAADWKAYSDNSAEGYHLEYVHPDLSRAVMPGTPIVPYENGRFIGFDVEYRNAAGDASGRGYWVYKFPGVLLHFSDHGFNMERVITTGPGRSHMLRWFWTTPGTDEQSRRQAIEDSTQVMGEDLAICENVQRNINSGSARRGVLSQEREPGTIYFQSLVREALAEAGNLPAP